MPCDTGSEPHALRQEFEGKNVDLSLVHEGWNNKVGCCCGGGSNKSKSRLLTNFGVQAGRYAPINSALKERARAARRWLKARPEKEIVVVTHGGFLHYFTEDWEDSSQYQGM